jgi:ABC-2 type transport system permease protein
MSDRARLRAFAALCSARAREFYREPEVVFWSFVFPVVLSVGLGLAFRSRPVEVSAVAVLEGSRAAELAEALGASSLLKVTRLSEQEARQALSLGRVDVAVAADSDVGVEYSFDPSRPEAQIARSRADDALQRAAGRTDPLAGHDVALSEPGGRYVDFLIPGLMGLNLMSGGMWGVGFNLVDMRIKRLLKRLLATPVRPADFLAVQMTMRVVLGGIEAAFVLLFGMLALGVPLRGSPAAVAVVGALGALCFASLGLLVASRARRIEGVTGLMNAVMVPMFIASGIFFSYERFPEALHAPIRLLPLTALNDALRAVVLEGASLVSQAGCLATLVVWCLASFALGFKLFRWS